MNGAGNDFIVIDSINNGPVHLTTQRIWKLCDRRKGIGADGILYLKEAKNFDYELEYYNSDGSFGSLCANGSRCSIKYACEYLFKDKQKISFFCNGEVFSGAIINNDEVIFNLHEPKLIKPNLKIHYCNQIYIFMES